MIRPNISRRTVLVFAAIAACGTLLYFYKRSTSSFQSVSGKSVTCDVLVIRNLDAGVMNSAAIPGYSLEVCWERNNGELVTHLYAYGWTYTRSKSQNTFAYKRDPKRWQKLDGGSEGFIKSGVSKFVQREENSGKTMLIVSRRQQNQFLQVRAPIVDCKLSDGTAEADYPLAVTKKIIQGFAVTVSVINVLIAEIELEVPIPDELLGTMLLYKIDAQQDALLVTDIYLKWTIVVDLTPIIQKIKDTPDQERPKPIIIK